MVFSTTWLEFKDMAQDPLVRRGPVSASCNRRPDECLETQKYNLYPKELPATKTIKKIFNLMNMDDGLNPASHPSS
jgi:hypothetical protein